MEKLELADCYLQIVRKWKEIGGPPTKNDRELVSEVLPLVVEAYRQEEISKGKLLELSKLLGAQGAELAAMA